MHLLNHNLKNREDRTQKNGKDLKEKKIYIYLYICIYINVII